MALEPHSRIYSRTAAGDEALASGDVAIPSDYRRILAVIETSTHTHVIRGRLRHFADELLEDWLAELEELGFISSITADVTQDLDFSSLLEAQRQSVRQAPPDDSQRLGIRAAQAAFDELGQKGVFLAADRIRHRPPLAKRASETCVLIVEDDPDQAALADLRVSMAGYAVRLARNCAELARELRTHAAPDIVLLDIMLPDGNGWDVLASIRRHPKLALLPVVMLTALNEPDEVRWGLALGADGYVTKPYSKSILAETIGAVLRHA
ncbi:MAG TPA: response regulator [Burkholderiales bacterium]|nr:response regulator [Burkholderiales bacterium]